MKLLLDECVPEDLKESIEGHEVYSASEMGWKGLKNGELMRRMADERFDAMLTADKNIRHQQNISKYEISVIIFEVYRNTLEELQAKLPELYKLLPTIERGKFYTC